jgi:proteasome activator subunit 4
MEVAMEEPIRSQGSFLDASRLYMVQGVVGQQQWRVGALLHRLLALLLPYLDHPFHNVRARLGSVLCRLFATDLEFGELGNGSLSSPLEREFVLEHILPPLSKLGTVAKVPSNGGEGMNFHSCKISFLFTLPHF